LGFFVWGGEGSKPRRSRAANGSARRSLVSAMGRRRVVFGQEMDTRIFISLALSPSRLDWDPPAITSGVIWKSQVGSANGKKHRPKKNKIEPNNPNKQANIKEKIKIYTLKKKRQNSQPKKNIK